MLQEQLTRLTLDGRKRASAICRLILAMTMAHLVLVGAGHADEIPIGDRAEPPYVIRTFRIPDGSISPDLKLTDTTVSLVGEPDSKSFGLSYRGLLDPETDLSGTEKLVGYFYVKCDDESPDKTKGVLIGSINVTDIKAGRESYTLIMTADAAAFLPLKHVECVKIGVR